MARKVFVEVVAKFDVEGHIHPQALMWTDGRTFAIDRVLDIAPRASLKVGGTGLRYACRILGQERHLFLDEQNRWFVEAL